MKVKARTHPATAKTLFITNLPFRCQVASRPFAEGSPREMQAYSKAKEVSMTVVREQEDRFRDNPLSMCSFYINAKFCEQ
jgi:arginase family enzyme